MPLHTANPASAGGAETGFGVSCWLASDTPVITVSSRILQAHWLEPRFQPSPIMVRYVAELAFDRRPAR
jgi:hypothetical protein